MCTVILLKNKGGEYPLVLFQNRNEMLDRSFSEPGEYWDSHEVLGAKDDISQGSWIAMNYNGLCATLLNKSGYMNYNYKSTDIKKIQNGRGQIVPRILTADNIANALAIISSYDYSSVLPFYLVISDKAETYCIDFDGKQIIITKISDNVNIITSRGINSSKCSRYNRFYKQIKEMNEDDVTSNNFLTWKKLLSIKSHKNSSDGMYINKENGIKTTSTSIVCLHKTFNHKNSFLFSREEPIINNFKEYYQC